MMNLNTNNTNNNRGQVVIQRTTRQGINNFTGLTKESHKIMSKNILRDTLYSWAPIYKMITITGVTQEGNLVYTVRNVIGGNSPVIKKFVEKNTTERSISVIQLDENHNETFRNVVCGSDEGRIRYDYTDELVLVRFKNLAAFTKEQEKASEKLVENVLSLGLTIDGNSVTVGKNNNGTYICPLIWTPSNERSGQILFTSVDSDEAWDRIESVGGGTISRKLSGGEMPLAKFKKLAARLGLFATPAIEFVKVGTTSHGALILNEELIGSSDFDKINKEILNSIGVNIEDNQWDGAAYFSASLALDGLRNIGMKHIDIKKALMFAFQLRVNTVYAKVFGEAIHQRVMNKIVEYITKHFEEGKHYRIYGCRDNISMVLDSNAAKLIDLEQDTDGMTVYLLDIAKGSESGTATQMTDKFALYEKLRTSTFVRERAKEDCHQYANSIGDNHTSLLDEDINVWQTLLGIAKNAPVDSNVGYNVFTDKYVMGKLLKDTSKKHESAYKKGRVSIASEFERALFDITYLITDGKINSLLSVDNRGAIECYSTDINEKYADEIAAIENNESLSDMEKDEQLAELLTACIIKYPTPGTEEIELTLFLTEQQVRRRIQSYVDNNVIDRATAADLFNYFSFTSYGVIKIAADNAIKHKLAGMDTDYDGVVVICEKELVSIIVDMYTNRKQKLEEKTGLIATHGGTIPFIDSSKDAACLYNKPANNLSVNNLGMI